MKANDTLIMKFLEGSKQFAVPLFQRTYSWGTEQIETMWEDIESTKNGEENVHFFGPFVTEPLPTSASGVSKYVIIDGQQRLVTTFLFLASIRNRIKDLAPESQIKDEIHELYLTNKYHPEDKYKLIPTQADRQIFFDLIDNKPVNHINYHLLLYAKDFFTKKLSEIDDVNELTSLKNTLFFESLNAKGTPLTQADLIRNYLFMRIRQENQEQVYKEIWFPMQEKLGKYLEAFIRHYLAMEGSIPNFNRIYSSFKEKADSTAKTSSDIIELMKNLAGFAGHYDKLLHPSKEGNESLKAGFNKLNRLEVTTSYPLLLMLYHDYAESKLPNEHFAKILKLIETFIVRRAVCGVPTNILNKYFPTIYASLDKNNVMESFRSKLKSETGQRRMPDASEFESALTNNSLYGGKILRYLLEEIERYDNKEVVDFDALQIEHIMPQTLSDEWKKQLGPNHELIHRKYVDTLGNLTLTGYNPEYSNKTFIEKRDMEKGFKQSGLRINLSLGKLDRWAEQEIVDRAKQRASVALKIWDA